MIIVSLRRNSWRFMRRLVVDEVGVCVGMLTGKALRRGVARRLIVCLCGP